jgi:hypothetical protein
MEQNKAAQDASAELDLTVLLDSSIAFLKKYSKLIALFLIVGGIIGYIVYRQSPKIYTSNILLQPYIITSSEQVYTINNFNQLLKQKQYGELAQLFGTDTTVFPKIRSMEADNGAAPGSGFRRDFTAFTVKLRVTDPSIIPAVQKGIIHAMESGSFVKEKLTLQRTSIRELIDITTQEISRLDSMRSLIGQSMQSPKTSGSNVIVDASEISRTSLLLNTQLRKLKDSLTFSEATRVLQDFYIPTSPDEPKLLVSVGGGAAGGMVLGFIVSVYLFVFRSMRARKQAANKNSHTNQPVTKASIKQN